MKHPRKIALCLMVGDGGSKEDFRKAIRSARSYVDEVCLLFTGRDEARRQEAERFAALLNARFHAGTFEDADGFLFHEARNASIQMASASHVFILDADEYLDASTDRAWRQALRDVRRGRYDVLRVVVESPREGGRATQRIQQERIFPATFRYALRQHHRLVDPSTASGFSRMLRRGDSPARLIHDGYNLTRQEQIAKNTPRLEGTRQVAEAAPPPLRSEYYYKYGQRLLSCERWDEAMVAFSEACRPVAVPREDAVRMGKEPPPGQRLVYPPQRAREAYGAMVQTCLSSIQHERRLPVPLEAAATLAVLCRDFNPAEALALHQAGLLLAQLGQLYHRADLLAMGRECLTRVFAVDMAGCMYQFDTAITGEVIRIIDGEMSASTGPSSETVMEVAA